MQSEWAFGTGPHGKLESVAFAASPVSHADLSHGGDLFGPDEPMARKFKQKIHFLRLMSRANLSADRLEPADNFLKKFKINYANDMQIIRRKGTGSH